MTMDRLTIRENLSAKVINRVGLQDWERFVL